MGLKVPFFVSTYVKFSINNLEISGVILYKL